jgi:hypothetical protein
MAFKRSSVRSRSAPPNNLNNNKCPISFMSSRAKAQTLLILVIPQILRKGLLSTTTVKVCRLGVRDHENLFIKKSIQPALKLHPERDISNRSKVE